MKSKKALEWYVIGTMIMLVVAAIFIILYQSGAFAKLGVIGSKGLFGWLGAAE